MKIRLLYYLCLALILMVGLAAGSFITISLAQPLQLGPGTGPSGTLTGCLGTASSSAASVSLAGRLITPTTLLRVSSSGPCDITEKNLNLFSYANTVLVSAGPDSAVNGTNLLATLSLIGGLSPSATKPFLLKLEPGVYDLGSNLLNMLPYVQLEGSGEDATKITAPGQPSPNSGVINGANNTEVRYLTVESRAGNIFSTAIYAGNGINNTFKLNHITVQVNGDTTNGNGIGIYNNSGSPLIDSVTVSVANTATSGGAYGIFNNASSAEIKNSRVQVQVGGTGTGIYVTNLSNVTVENSNIVVIVNGGSFAYAALNDSGGASTATLTVHNTTLLATASNKPNCQALGLITFGGLISAYNTNVTTSIGIGCYNSYGLVVQGAPNVINFNNGYVKSSNFAIYNGTSNKIRIGASQLDTPTLAGADQALCIASFRGDYSPTNADCS